MMMASKEGVTVVAVWFLLHCSFQANPEAFDNNAKLAFDRARGAPRVSPNSTDLTVARGDKLWFNCSCREPITWQYAAAYNVTEQVITTNSKLDGWYLSSVHIPNALEEHVGQYYCIKNASRDFWDEFKDHLDDLEAQFNATSIYLFVTDARSTVVPHGGRYIDAIDGLGFMAQCKPTSKDVEVELVTYNEKTPFGQADRKKGVFVGWDDLDNDMSYICRDQDRPSDFMVLETRKLARAVRTYRPKITSRFENVVPVGAQVVLQCEVPCCTGRRLDMHWFLDNEPIYTNYRIHVGSMNYTINEEDFCLDTIHQTLTIRNVTLEEAGSYQCTVSARQDNDNFANYKLYVVDPTAERVRAAHRQSRDVHPSDQGPERSRGNRNPRDVDSGAFVSFDAANNPTVANVSRLLERPVRVVLGYYAFPTLTATEWYKDGRRLGVQRDGRLREVVRPKELQLVIRDPTVNDIGRYTVVAKADDAQDSYDFDVYITDKPRLTMASVNATPGELVHFVCRSEAFPEPVVEISFVPCPSLQWTSCLGNRTGQRHLDSVAERLSLYELHHTISFAANEPGIVRCLAANREGKDEREAYLIVVRSPVVTVAVSVLAVLFAVLLVAVALFVRHRRRTFPGKFPLPTEDEELAIPERYEFPRRLLRLGTQLGSGQFGVVLQAVAHGIVVDGEDSTVAVKLVRDQHDAKVLSVLIAELKVMLHIGHHLNVVNLLGAVTKDVPKSDVMMIVEYCKYGNLAEFLLNNRHYYIDELDPVTGQLTTTLSRPEDLGISGTRDGHTYRTSHLCSWATQVARGMSFLVARNVLHGDLAARNVLLCPANVVKICDFGLARTLYRTSVYKKTSEDPLPLKWLALECITERTFSTHSDVWAYGIFLWELFSHGTVPYPELANNVELLQQLKRGYRMEKPRGANFEMYNVMLNCWRLEPTGRPSFEQLYQWFHNMLPPCVQQQGPASVLQIGSDNRDLERVRLGSDDGTGTALTDLGTNGTNVIGYVDMNGLRRG